MSDSSYISPFYRTYCYDPDRVHRSPSQINPKRRPPKYATRRVVKSGPLPPKHQAVLDFIRKEIFEQRPFPMLKSIRWEIGNKSNTYSEHILKVLVARGYISKCERGTRGENGKIVRWRLIPESVNPLGHESDHASVSN